MFVLRRNAAPLQSPTSSARASTLHSSARDDNKASRHVTPTTTDDASPSEERASSSVLKRRRSVFVQDHLRQCLHTTGVDRMCCMSTARVKEKLHRKQGCGLHLVVCGSLRDNSTLAAARDDQSLAGGKRPAEHRNARAHAAPPKSIRKGSIAGVRVSSPFVPARPPTKTRARANDRKSCADRPSEVRVSIRRITDWMGHLPLSPPI